MAEDPLQRAVRIRVGIAVGGLLGGVAGAVISSLLGGPRGVLVAALLVVGALGGAVVAVRRADGA
jgi:hypothetical protein